MPIVERGSELLEGIALSLDLPSQMPEISDIRGTGGVPGSIDTAARAWRRKTGIIFQQSMQQTLGGILTSTGIPAHQMRKIPGGPLVNVFESVLEGFGTPTTAIEIVKTLVSDLELEETLKDTAIAVSSDIAGAIPIIGAVIELVINVVQIAVDAARASKKEEKILYERSGFTKAQDAAHYTENFVIPLQSSRDWSGIFSPPGWELRYGQVAQTFASSGLVGGGDRIVITNPEGTPVGQMPGTNYLHQSFELPDVGPMYDVGQFLPTSQQQATWLWKQVQATGPSLFTVNAAHVASRWGDYLLFLRRWMHESGKIPRGQSEKIVKFWAKAVGWPAFRADQQPTWENMRIEHTLPVRNANALRDRQLKALDTLTCAYVDKSYAAIAGDKPMELRWDHRRYLLLKHPARFTVDLRNVPDAQYRGDLERSGVTRFGAPIGGIANGGKPKPLPPVEKGRQGGLALAAAAEGDGVVLRPGPKVDPVERVNPGIKGGGGLLAVAVVGGLAASAAKARGLF